MSHQLLLGFQRPPSTMKSTHCHQSMASPQYIVRNILAKAGHALSSLMLQDIWQSVKQCETFPSKLRLIPILARQTNGNSPVHSYYMAHYLRTANTHLP